MRWTLQLLIFTLVYTLSHTVYATDDQKKCDKDPQTYCWIKRNDLTIGDRVGFFHYGNLVAVGKVSDINPTTSERRVELVEKYGTIYKATSIKYLGEDLDYATESQNTATPEFKQRLEEKYTIHKKLNDFNVSVNAGMSSFEISSNVKGFEALASGDYRLIGGLKAGGRMVFAKGSGEINRLSTDIYGFDWGVMDVNYFGIYPGLSYTAFERNMISLRLNTSAGLGYISGSIDEDPELLEDPEYETFMKNGAGFGGRASGSVLVDVKFADLEFYVASNMIHETFYTSIGAGLSRDF